jgi:hypothetical protein
MGFLVPALQTLAAPLLLAAALAGLGRLTRGRGGLPPADLGAGLGLFGLACLVLARLGMELNTAVWLLVLVGLGLFGLDLRNRLRQHIGPRVFLLHLPLVVLAAFVPITHWDEFTHWLPNADYLLQNGAFAGPGQPLPDSLHGTYPPGSALITFTAAQIMRGLFGLQAMPETAVPVVTVLLLGSIAAGLSPWLRIRGVEPWLAAAVALLCVVWMNPGLIQRLMFSNLGDVPTAALMGVAVVLALRGLEARDPWAAVQASFVLAAIVNIKQTGIILVALMLGLTAMLVLVERGPDLARRLAALCLGAVPPLLIWGLWRSHAAISTGGFTVRPFADWAWGLAPATLASMATIAMRKAAFTLLLLACIVIVLLAIRQRGATSLARAAWFAGGLGLGWAATLFLAYMGTSFSRHEIQIAASFWRYWTNISGVLGIVLVFILLQRAVVGQALAELLDRLPPIIRRRAPGAMVLLVPLLPMLVIGYLWPGPRDIAPPLRKAAAAVQEAIAGQGPVLLIDPRGNGTSYTVLAYAWRGTARVVWAPDYKHQPQLPLAGDPGRPSHEIYLPALNAASVPAAELRRRADAVGALFVMLVSTDAEVESAFATPPLPRGGWRLLRRAEEGWRVSAEGGPG